MYAERIRSSIYPTNNWVVLKPFWRFKLSRVCLALMEKSKKRVLLICAWFSMYPELSFRVSENYCTMDFSVGSNSRMKILRFSSYLVPIQSKTTTVRVSYDVNKRFIPWLNLVPSSCWVLRLLSWFDALRAWSRPALAEDTYWFSSVLLRWSNSYTSQSRLSGSLDCQQLGQQIQMYRKGQLLCCSSREKKTGEQKHHIF